MADHGRPSIPGARVAPLGSTPRSGSTAGPGRSSRTPAPSLRAAQCRRGGQAGVARHTTTPGEPTGNASRREPGRAPQGRAPERRGPRRPRPRPPRPRPPAARPRAAALVPGRADARAGARGRPRPSSPSRAGPHRRPPRPLDPPHDRGRRGARVTIHPALPSSRSRNAVGRSGSIRPRHGGARWGPRWSGQSSRVADGTRPHARGRGASRDSKGAQSGLSSARTMTSSGAAPAESKDCAERPPSLPGAPEMRNASAPSAIRRRRSPSRSAPRCRASRRGRPPARARRPARRTPRRRPDRSGWTPRHRSQGTPTPRSR